MIPPSRSPLTYAFWEYGRVDDCPIFDTHAHYGPFSGIYFPDRGEVDAMLAVMERVGIRIALVSGHAALIDPARGNEIVAGLVAAHPGRFRGYLVANPNYPQQIARDLGDFAQWQARGFVGFKIHPSSHKYSLTGDNYRPLFEFANARRIPLLSHTWGADGLCGTKQVREIVSTYRSMPFLAGHACYDDWDAAIALAARHDNLYLELTAAYAYNGLLERMVAGMGAHKIMFGNDLPWFDSMYAVGCVLSARITDDDRRAILYRNAEQLFGL
ncbi:MAG: amidohydrolase family protein [Anaerolineae bacterium]|nr:amidohydrolase family protein [Anaerolineae bacterium]